MHQKIDELTKAQYEAAIVAYVSIYKELRPRKNYYNGDCPICGHRDHSNPCFSIKGKYGFVLLRCFHKDCGFSGNIYSFIAAVKNCTTEQAINDFREYVGLPPLVFEEPLREDRVALPFKLISALSGNGKFKTNKLIKQKMSLIHKYLYRKDYGESFIADLAFNPKRRRQVAWTWCFQRCYERLGKATWKNEQQFLYEVISELNIILEAVKPPKSEAQKQREDLRKYNGNRAVDAMSFRDYEQAMTCPEAHLSRDRTGQRRVAYNGEAIPVCYLKEGTTSLEDKVDTAPNPEETLAALTQLKDLETRLGKVLTQFQLGLISAEEASRELKISKATLYRRVKEHS